MFSARASGQPLQGETRQGYLRRLSTRRFGNSYLPELLREVVALREEVDVLRVRVRQLEDSGAAPS